MMLAGLGLVFLGLQYMGMAMDEFCAAAGRQRLSSVSVDNRLVLLLAGIIITGIVQSSSAVTTLIVQMVGAGLVIGDPSNSGVLFLVLGTNIGTCVTALLSSIGANTNAKRAALIHLMFNVFGTVIFSIFLLCWPGFMDATLGKWFANDPGLQIALFHTFFNVVCTCIFLPFANVFVKVSTKLIREPKGQRNPPRRHRSARRALHLHAVGRGGTGEQGRRAHGGARHGIAANRVSTGS